MKAYLINMHLLVPRSRSSAKVTVKYKGYISQKMAVSGAFVFHKHILLSMQNYVTGKGCLMLFTLGFFFFYSQSKHFLIFLRQFKIFVADQKPRPHTKFVISKML